MKHLILSILAPLVFLAATAHASELYYTATTVSSGTYNGNTFTDETVTFLASADTSSITTDGGLVYLIPGPVSVTVSNVGGEVLQASGGGVVLNAGEGGITAVNFGPSIDPNAPANFGFFAPVAGYANAPFGPVQSTGIFGSQISGSGGSISLSNIGTITFQVTDQLASTTPEPGSLVFTGATLVGLVLAIVSRRRRTSREIIRQVCICECL